MFRFNLPCRVMLVLAICAGPAGGEVWDIAADWSDAINPNGPWSYNTDIDLPMDNHLDDYGMYGGDPPQPAWAFAPVTVPGQHLPSFFKNVFELSGEGGDLPEGHFFCHGNDIYNSPDPYKYATANVTWISPVDGPIAIQGGV